MMIFNDDEPIVLPPGTTRPTVPGRVQLVTRNNDKEPLEEKIQKMMLEFTGEEESRSGLDLVLVLDVSNSMGVKLKNLQKATKFVMRKLSVVDRLSIVKYNYDAERLCPLRQMTESTQTELQNLINYLIPKWDSMNITDGLLMALKILNDRSVSSGRVGAIMLISSGMENRGNAATVPLGNVPVHTFGFGNWHDPKVLMAIANNSLGGTYSDVSKDNMTIAFSQCLGGLLSVVGQDLTVTISQIEGNSTIRQVSADAKFHETMRLKFDDDDPTVLAADSEPVQLLITSNDVALLEKNIQKVLLELSSEKDRQIDHKLDLVAVLDVSSSMEGDKLEKMKMAMLHLIHSCYDNYRLSIVEYSSKAKRLCPLRLMTESFQEKLRNLIHDLECQPGTNITDGLETALKVLKDRSVSSGRVGVIILMSDGEQNQGGDAADFPVGNVPVLTFDFGTDHPEVLIAIANNSGLGGTYTEVCMDNYLNLNFSHYFDELQRVVVWDLTVTVNQIKNESTVICASAGRYLQSIDNDAGSVTTTLGTLYMKESHFVLVDILLPVTKTDHEAQVLKISYTYRRSFDGERCEARHDTVTVHRMSDLTAEKQQPELEVTFQEAKLLIAEMIKKATGVANKEDLKSVRDKLVHNLKSLQYMNNEIWSGMLSLRYELEELSQLMQSQAINENQGHSSAYSLLISHYTQRCKERDTILSVSPALREFLEEAMMYDDIDELLLYMDRFICALESIVMIIGEFING